MPDICCCCCCCSLPAVHVHLVDFFILQRGHWNNPLEPEIIDFDPKDSDNPENGLFEYERLSPKDVLYLGPSQEMWVIAR